MTTRTEGGKRRRIVKPYPAYTLEDALDVAQAIQNANAGLPFARALLAGALGTTPKVAPSRSASTHPPHTA